MLSTVGIFSFTKCSSSTSFLTFKNKIKMDSKLGFARGLEVVSETLSSSSPSKEDYRVDNNGDIISLEEWQGWGTCSPRPAMVMEIVEEMKKLEKDLDTQMSFGGMGAKLQEVLGDSSMLVTFPYRKLVYHVNSPVNVALFHIDRTDDVNWASLPAVDCYSSFPSRNSILAILLQGNFKVQEDKKHRATYKALGDSEQKQQFFSSRQVACRVLGSRGYLCQKCWLAQEDCMCSKIKPSSLWPGMRFWLYMHPKDFLRQNNTGKVLWQIFGVEAATLCIFGIPEHEEIMWDAFKLAGKSRVWCLYPDKNASTKSVQDGLFSNASKSLEAQKMDVDTPLHFVLLDGTWSNSAAMFSRLKEHAKVAWGEEEFPCISLSELGESPMHKLRPQPSWDRTCTAAAALGLLSELHLLPEFSSIGLDKHAEDIEDGLEILLKALTGRRLRMGRSITRTEKYKL
ncbi:hypothetical protein C5167_009147 [Papaver somniferum]|uniref:tRNA-uridine aminocarboxypropyltransferase n=1 Tax=Papaver somniferum TaxID=3469 RepID=A0A4Y7JXN2_PAPSO|nr:hypothetical protein C5167_009147 [Papaver somniferum]